MQANNLHQFTRSLNVKPPYSPPIPFTGENFYGAAVSSLTNPAS